jgi:hypothetical protein
MNAVERIGVKTTSEKLLAVERGSLSASAVMMIASAVIGFRWVSSPYLPGYASAGCGFFVVSRLAASCQRRLPDSRGDD